ncbi:hypothetical protein [uncultured Agrobacterium sp.]|uniref:hypothetical protein n=1 Tax=uncultured Agrobacterium sp. TaxID=157277 RepID=UPI0025CDECB7|nr:hypothetical protein [uncultured Agrobacterium sp.]
MTETAPANLQEYVLAQVAAKTSEDHIRQLIDKKLDEVIQGAVDDEFRYGGNLKKQITEAVSGALQVGGRLDIPAYGVMVMALLRDRLEANVSELLNKKLAADMDELLKISPKELKFSQVVESVIEDAKESKSWGSVSIIVEGSEYIDGAYHVGLDHDSGIKKRYECDTQFYVDPDGKISSLTVNRRDVTKVVGVAPYRSYQKMIFSAYACGSKLIMDDLDPSLEYGDY